MGWNSESADEQSGRGALYEIRQQEAPRRALLVGVDLGRDPEFASSMKELEKLAKACGMEVADTVVQAMASPTPRFYIGSGKVEELRGVAAGLGITDVIFEDTLSPSQHKNLQKEFDAQVMDRTNLILEIFARRARTREARLQVESANLQYLLPRLVGMREYLGRQGGASGSMSNKGSGEKQLELDRRKIEKRIAELRRELEAIENDRAIQRRRRAQSALPQAALVGYTNAGKSTLLNKMVELYGGREEKQVLAQDMLFATLDTTVRRISPEDRRDFLLSDTVGFVSSLPHGLVKAFRSTLDEVRFADLLIEVVDVSDERYREQMEVTRRTLKELGAEKLPCIHVMNKADRRFSEEELPRVEGDRIFLSAKQGVGIERLRRMIGEILFADNRRAVFLLPYDRGDLVSYLNGHATVFSQEYLPEGVRVEADCGAADYRRLERYVKKEARGAEI